MTKSTLGQPRSALVHAVLGHGLVQRCSRAGGEAFLLAPAYGMAWYGMVWYGMAWYGMVWYGMAWYGMVWYGMVW